MAWSPEAVGAALRSASIDVAIADVRLEPRDGRQLVRLPSRDRIRLYNAAAAASFLAFRDGVPPEQRWCGRTLAEDLAWVRDSLDR